MGRRRPGLVWMLLLAMLMYGLISAGVAVATADTCGEVESAKTWQFFPPGWDCTPRPL